MVVQHAQVSFHLSPDAAVQLVAYDAALGAYAALQRRRPLAAAHAAITLPAQLALRAVSLRPRGTCLNQALPGLEPELGSGSGSGSGSVAGAGAECVPSPCERRCQRAGDVELTQACEGRRDAALCVPDSPQHMGQAAEQAAWSARSLPAAPYSADACAAAGAAEILPVSVSASAASMRSTERALTAAELWAGHQATQVRSNPIYIHAPQPGAPLSCCAHV